MEDHANKVKGDKYTTSDEAMEIKVPMEHTLKDEISRMVFQ